MTATENLPSTTAKRDYQRYRFLLHTLEPVHVGTGAYRLGRVDNPIAREPATHLPKIPGSSLHGALRSYAARKWCDDSGSTWICSGVGKRSAEDKAQEHCGKCPVCYTFGHIKGAETGNSGVVSIGDARLLLFPVHSMAGPVWITSVRTLADSGLGTAVLNDPNKVLLGSDLHSRDRLNLGWLMMQKEGALDTAGWKGIHEYVRKHAVVVDDGLFSRVVNSNLEIRTSVAIDPDSGAASKGKLFTYEAIPRATWLWMEVIQDNYRQDAFPSGSNGWTAPVHVLQAGFQCMALLGVGGMGTRGFGRVQAKEWL